MISRFYKHFFKYKKTIYCYKEYCNLSNHEYKQRNVAGSGTSGQGKAGGSGIVIVCDSV